MVKLLVLVALASLGLAAPSKSTRYSYTYYKTARNSCPSTLPTKSATPIPFTSTTATPKTTTKSASSTSAVPSVTAFANSKGAVLPQLIALDKKQNQIVYDLRNTSQIVYHLPDNKRAVVDNHGISLFDEDCSSELRLPVPNLSAALASATKTKRSEAITAAPDGVLLDRRAAATSVSVDLGFFDQCGYPITGHKVYGVCELAYPAYDTVETTQVRLTAADEAGFYSGTCDIPSSDAREEQCEKSVKALIDYPSKMANVIGALGFIAERLPPLLATGSTQGLAVGIAAAFEIPAFGAALFGIGLYAAIVELDGDVAAAKLICQGYKHGTLTVREKLDTSKYPIEVSYQNSQPFTSVMGLAEFQLPEDVGKACPACNGAAACRRYPYRCAQNPYCGCGVTTEGKNICWSPPSLGGASCGTTNCASSSDCGSGYVCAIDPCCGGTCTNANFQDCQ